MIKSIFLVILQMSYLLVDVFGQATPLPGFYLSNYTFSTSSKEIGIVKLRNITGGIIKSVVIGGEHGKSIKISRDYRLSVVSNKIEPGIKWLDLVLNVKTSAGNLKDTVRIVNEGFIRNKVIAHRGAWKNTGATENSIASLQHAISLGCEGSEFDVHMSTDSVMYIHHDPAVSGVSIAKSTSAVLKDIKLSNGEPLPTLTDYLKTGIQQNKTKLILEIKISELGKQSSLALTNKVVNLVEQMHAQGWVDYISFDYDICKEVMKLAPYARVSYLNGDKMPAELAENNFYGLDYHFSVFQKKPDLIKEAQQHKITVNVWTVNDPKMMEQLLQQNVDFITTNEPEMLLKLVSPK